MRVPIIRVHGELSCMFWPPFVFNIDYTLVFRFCFGVLYFSARFFFLIFLSVFCFLGVLFCGFGGCGVYLFMSRETTDLKGWKTK